MTNPPLDAVVVLLHGLARTGRSMQGLGEFLRASGFEVWNCTWPSRRASLAQAADQVLSRLDAELPGRPLIAVTHSLGAALALHIAERRPLLRAVFLAPPLRGSRVARSFVDWGIFRWFYGPAGREVAADLPDWPALHHCGQVAVIAGNHALALSNPVSWATRGLGVLPAQLASDGTVALDETRPDAPHAFAEVAATHTWIMNDPQVQQLVLAFVRHGHWPQPEEPQPPSTAEPAPGSGSHAN